MKHNYKSKSKGRTAVTKADKKMMKRGAMMKSKTGSGGGGVGMKNIGVGSSNNASGRSKAMKYARMRDRTAKRR